MGIDRAKKIVGWYHYYPAHLRPSPIIFNMAPSQSKRWCFTTNNYTDVQVASTKALFDSDDVRYGVFGFETGESGTPHLQGFIIFHRNKRFNAVSRLLPGSHLAATGGTSVQARDYCKKDGNFYEKGDFPESGGRRSDLDAILEWADDFTSTHGRAPTDQECAREQPRAFIKYPRLMRTLQLRAPAPVLQDGDARPWQTQLEEELNGEADARSVIFYLDTEGGKGKTWFQQWYYSKYPGKTQLLTIGKRDDLAHAIDESKSVFLFNVPRGSMEYFQYCIAESLKDKTIFSPKYFSHMKFLRSVPHVVVFCNEEPDNSKMSIDRFDIRNL